MPYRWSDTKEGPQLVLWPHRSLSPEGFATFFSITAAMLMIPLLAVLGTMLLWWILPFMVGAVGLTWIMLQRNTQDGRLREVLTLAKTEMELVRINPSGPEQRWQANPYWVRVQMFETGGPVANYITLKGGTREVEIGAFLSPEERVDLYAELQDRLRRMDVNAH